MRQWSFAICRRLWWNWERSHMIFAFSSNRKHFVNLRARFCDILTEKSTPTCCAINAWTLKRLNLKSSREPSGNWSYKNIHCTSDCPTRNKKIDHRNMLRMELSAQWISSFFPGILLSMNHPFMVDSDDQHFHDEIFSTLRGTWPSKMLLNT